MERKFTCVTFFGYLLGFILLVFPFYGSGQQAIQGDWSAGGWGSWSSFSASSGNSLIYTKNFGSTGNKYFRLQDNSNNDRSPTCVFGNDIALTSGTEITSWNASANCGNGAWYYNVPNTSYNYVLKSYSAASSPQFIMFEVQGTIRTISSVSPTAPTVTSGQSLSVSVTMSGNLATGQNAYLRYTTDNWSTNTVIAMTSGTPPTYTVASNIPSQSAGTTVKYKVFTSGTSTPSGTPAQVDYKVINESSEYSYTVASAVTSAQSGNWNTGTTWVGGVVPSSGSAITIANGHTVTLDANVTVSSITINNGGTLNGGSGSNTITVNSGGTIQNDGTYSGNTETISFSGAGTIKGANASTLNSLTLNGALTVTTSPTVNGTLTINSGGSLSAAVTYGSSSTLTISTSMTRSNEWTTATSGAGYPANVTISNNSTYTFKPSVDGSGKCSGNLTINSGSTFTMTDMVNPLTILGNLSISGTMTLSTIGVPGPDIYLSGNLTRGASSTFTANNKAMVFKGSGTQTITYTGGGTWQFDYFTIDKPSGNVVLSSSPATNVSVVATSSYVFRIINAGGLDLNGQTLTIGCTGGCNGGNIYVDGANGSVGSVVSSVSGGTMRVQGNSSSTLNKTVANANGGTFTIGSTAILAINNCYIDPGSSLTTINGELDIETGGSILTNAPTYGTGSTLKFITGTQWNVTTTTTSGTPQKVWVPGSSGAGVPYNVYVKATASAGTELNFQSGNQGTNGFYVRNTLTIEGTSNANQGIVTLTNTNSPNTIYIGQDYYQKIYSTLNENSQKLVFYGGPSGNNAQVINITEDADPDGLTVYDMEINQSNSGTVTLYNASNNNLTITNTLTLTKGYLVVNSNTVIFNSSASHSGASTASFIVTNYTSGNGSSGCVKKKALGTAANFTFPIGPSSSSYNPVYFETSVSHTSDDISARVVVGLPSSTFGYGGGAEITNTTRYVNRTWELFEAVAGGSNGDLSFTWSASHENASFSRTSSNVYHYKSSTNTYETITVNSRSGTDPYTHRAGAVTSFSPYVVGSQDPTVLPIELISFTGKVITSGNFLEWSTATETDNDYFTIEKSYDGKSFEAIANIKGGGNSRNRLDYNYMDQDLNNVIYYRLKQTDYDGKFSYSKLISIKKISNSPLAIDKVYVDNAGKGEIQLNNSVVKSINIQLTDVLGKIILTQQASGTNGNFQFDASELKKGQVYMLKVFDDEHVLVKKFYY